MAANLENSTVATGLKKVSFHFNSKEMQYQKCSNYCTIVLISHPSKVMFKILQAMYETSCQSRFDARYWMLGAGALG